MSKKRDALSSPRLCLRTALQLMTRIYRDVTINIEVAVGADHAGIVTWPLTKSSPSLLRGSFRPPAGQAVVAGPSSRQMVERVTNSLPPQLARPTPPRRLAQGVVVFALTITAPPRIRSTTWPLPTVHRHR